MEPEESYGKRLHQAAWKDFRSFWSDHRLWVTGITLISPFLVQLKNHGWSSLGPRDVIESAGLALGLSLLGNYLIAMFKGAKTLDIAHQEKIGQRDQEIEGMTQRIQVLSQPPDSDPAEEFHRRTATEAVVKLSGAEIKLLQWLWTHGSVKTHLGSNGIPNRAQLCLPGMLPDAVLEQLRTLAATPLVSYRHDRDLTGEFCVWEIAAGHRNAIGKLIFSA